MEGVRCTLGRVTRGIKPNFFALQPVRQERCLSAADLLDLEGNRIADALAEIGAERRDDVLDVPAAFDGSRRTCSNLRRHRPRRPSHCRRRCLV